MRLEKGKNGETFPETRIYRAFVVGPCTHRYYIFSMPQYYYIFQIGRSESSKRNFIL